MRFALLFAVLTISQAMSAQKAPSGLWQSKEVGFVVKIAACGSGFCGYAAAAPAGKKKDPKMKCGQQMWSNFTWNSVSSRWEGTMNPPDIDKSIKAFITTDNLNSLTMTAKVMFLTKTMNFTPFRGSVTESCEIKQ